MQTWCQLILLIVCVSSRDCVPWTNFYFFVNIRNKIILFTSFNQYSLKNCSPPLLAQKKIFHFIFCVFCCAVLLHSRSHKPVFRHINTCTCVFVRACVFLCAACKSFMCNDSTINFCLQCYVFNLIFLVSFYFILPSFCLLTRVQCGFRFSVVSVYFGVKSIEPTCPNNNKNENK